MLDPSAFASLGPLHLTAGTYTIDTTLGTLVDDGSGSTLFSGVNFAQGTPGGAPFHGFNPAISVFTFDSVLIDPGVTVTALGERPLALLSQSTFTVNSTVAQPTLIDVSGQDGMSGLNTASTEDPADYGHGGRGGPGGGKGGDGSIRNSVLDFFVRSEPGEGPGGGFGGGGGLGDRGNGAGFGGFGGGGFGGTVIDSSYGDLKVALQAGSGGGASGPSSQVIRGPGGGGGGGGLELGAVTSLVLNGTIDASGGSQGGANAALGGGGAGGGVRLHAPTVSTTTSATVNANGGGPAGGPGAGGGGRILVLNSDGSMPSGLNLTVNTITPFVGPTRGIIEFGVLPLPAGDLNAQITTGSPQTLSQTFATVLNSNSTPFNQFELIFDTEFLTATGELDVLLDGTNVGTISAPGTAPSGVAMHTLAVDGSMFPGNSHTLEFVLDGPTGSIVQVDNVQFPGIANGTFQAGILGPWNASGMGSVELAAPIPEPSACCLAIVAAAGLVVAARRRRR